LGKRQTGFLAEASQQPNQPPHVQTRTVTLVHGDSRRSTLARTPSGCDARVGIPPLDQVRSGRSRAQARGLTSQLLG
jgi:hypothetical protein